GRAETPTDPAPLSMFETVVTLKPESEWRKGMTWERLNDEMDRTIRFPGMPNIFWMPIMTRTEMLATGFRTPVGVKVLGPDRPALHPRRAGGARRLRLRRRGRPRPGHLRRRGEARARRARQPAARLPPRLGGAVRVPRAGARPARPPRAPDAAHRLRAPLSEHRLRHEDDDHPAGRALLGRGRHLAPLGARLQHERRGL